MGRGPGEPPAVLRREPALATRLIDRGKIGVLRAIRQGDVDDPFSLVDQQQLLVCRGDETLRCDVAIGTRFEGYSSFLLTLPP